jgi:glyoxylate/hydroxypyruvate reductase
MQRSEDKAMTLLVAVNGAGDNWAPEKWVQRFKERLPEMPVALLGRDQLDAVAVKFVAVWQPSPGILAAYPNLAAIFNLGAGVDALLRDATLPNVPLVRVVNPDLTQRMTEYVVLHVLMHHRQQRLMDRSQADRKWTTPEQWPAAKLRVGIMGMGALGQDAADVLARIGFQVAGWSRTPKSVPGVPCFAGADGLDPFLARTDVLVVLLPMTAETRGILNRALFSKLAKDGPLGAPVLINAGRGLLQVEADIISCLDDGTLGAATLDVFNQEPLAADHPLWTHSKVTVTPHNSADSDPEAISDYVVSQIRRYQRGEPLHNVVSRDRGY